MNKIFEMDFNSEADYMKTISIIKELGNFSMYNDYFYLETQSKKEDIKLMFKESNINLISIKEINKNNYTEIANNSCKDWCHKILVNMQIKLLELSKQERLKQIDKDLDYLLELKKQGTLEEYLSKNNISLKDRIGKMNIDDMSTETKSENK